MGDEGLETRAWRWEGEEKLCQRKGFSTRGALGRFRVLCRKVQGLGQCKVMVPHLPACPSLRSTLALRPSRLLSSPMSPAAATSRNISIVDSFQRCCPPAPCSTQGFPAIGEDARVLGASDCRSGPGVQELDRRVSISIDSHGGRPGPGDDINPRNYYFPKHSPFGADAKSRPYRRHSPIFPDWWNLTTTLHPPKPPRRNSSGGQVNKLCSPKACVNPPPSFLRHANCPEPDPHPPCAPVPSRHGPPRPPFPRLQAPRTPVHSPYPGYQRVQSIDTRFTPVRTTSHFVRPLSLKKPAA